ncbi:MAG TPA: hypothetical protein VL918_04435 [Sphingobium sp.]|nr:hypothetical protein [Sphingobium sp.]
MTRPVYPQVVAVAATVRPIKMLALSTASLSTIITLIWHRIERLRKPAGSRQAGA